MCKLYIYKCIAISHTISSHVSMFPLWRIIIFRLSFHIYCPMCCWFCYCSYTKCKWYAKTFITHSGWSAHNYHIIHNNDTCLILGNPKRAVRIKNPTAGFCQQERNFKIASMREINLINLTKFHGPIQPERERERIETCDVKDLRNEMYRIVEKLHNVDASLLKQATS